MDFNSDFHALYSMNFNNFYDGIIYFNMIAKWLSLVSTFVHYFHINGIVHPKMTIHSLSTHHYVDGGVGEVFESTKHFCSLRGKLCCSKMHIQLK